MTPNHPMSNGLAEREVRIVKETLNNEFKDLLETQPVHFLFHCRLTPTSTTSLLPSELSLRQHPHSQFHLVKPDLHQCVINTQVFIPMWNGRNFCISRMNVI